MPEAVSLSNNIAFAAKVIQLVGMISKHIAMVELALLGDIGSMKQVVTMGTQTTGVGTMKTMIFDAARDPTVAGT